MAIVCIGAIWIALSQLALLSIVGTLRMGNPWWALFEGAVGIVALGCGIGLIARRPWARMPLMALCAAAVVQWGFLATKILGVIYAPDGPPPGEARLWAFAVFTGAIALSAPFIGMAAFLAWGRTRDFLSSETLPQS
jgi:hypothetical protein